MSNLAQFHDALSRLDAKGHWLYRGQTDASWGLIPSIFRGIDRLVPSYDVVDAKWIIRIERDMYRAFEQHARKYQATQNQWELLALAQHYGTPTRLLDWTRSASIAAYFAVATMKPAAATVWCLNVKNYPFPDFLGRISNTYAHRVDVITSVAAKRQPSFFQMVSKRFVAGPLGPRSKPLLPDPVSERDSGFLLILDPPRFDERLRAQEGLFTLYYSFDDYDLVWDLSIHFRELERAAGTDMLWRLDIPEAHREQVRHEFERHDNMSWHRLFPDLVGLGQWLAGNRDAEFAAIVAARK